MRKASLALLLLLTAFAGCLDGDSTPDDPADEDPGDEEPADPEPQLEDRGEYTYDPETGLCEAKDFTEPGPGVYQSEIGGGVWGFQESNGIPGLQYEDNHALSGQGLGFELPVEDCTGGDQVIY